MATKKGLSYHALAKLTGASHASVVRRWCIGEMVPSPIFMKRIFVITNGTVEPNDFYPDLGLSKREQFDLL